MFITKKIILFLILIPGLWGFLFAEWEQLESGVFNDLNAIDFWDVNTGITVGGSGVILRTENGGLDWDVITVLTDNELNDVCFVNQNIVLAVGDGPVILRSVNSGETWEEVTVPGLMYNLYSVSVHSSGTGIAGGAAQTILSTENFGVDWTIVQTDYMGGGFWGAHMSSSTIGFLAGQNSIFQPLVARTVNNCSSFNFYAFYLNDNGNWHEGKLYGCYFFDDVTGHTAAARWDGWGCITHTTDLNNWNSLHYPNAFHNIDFHGDKGYAVGDNGIVKYTNNDILEWVDDFPGVTANLKSVDVLQDHVYISGESGMILKKDEGVSADNSHLHFISFLQNFPNPFGNETVCDQGTSIVFQLSEAGYVKLDIFNIKGQKITTLISQVLESGEHSVQWIGKDLPHGVYFYRIRTPNGSLIRKMVKMR